MVIFHFKDPKREIRFKNSLSLVLTILGVIGLLSILTISLTYVIVVPIDNNRVVSSLTQAETDPSSCALAFIVPLLISIIFFQSSNMLFTPTEEDYFANQDLWIKRGIINKEDKINNKSALIQRQLKDTISQKEQEDRVNELNDMITNNVKVLDKIKYTHINKEKDPITYEVTKKIIER